MINILIADNQTLTREGVKAVLLTLPDVKILGQVEDLNELEIMITQFAPNVIIIDHNYRDHFNTDDIKYIHTKFPASRLLILSNTQNREEILDLIDAGINNYIFKECSVDDLVGAVYATVKGERFFCEDTRQIIADEQPAIEIANLSSREAEIVQLIAAGMTNKEIAERLFLSIHTVKTHRKNIIKKLGFTFKNAADLMQYTTKID